MTTNTLLTIDMVTRQALAIFRQSNAFLMAINRDYQSMFGRESFKIGDTLRIRKPVQYAVNEGASLVIQNTVEEYVTLTVATQKNVGVSFTSAEQTMQLEDYADLILAPMVNNLASAISLDVFGGVNGIENVINTTASGFNDGAATISPTAKTWLNANALLSTWDCPTDRRMGILHPFTQANTVGSLMGLLVPGSKIGEQYSKGLMGTDSLGMNWFMDQNVGVHTTGAYGALGTTATSGSPQTGSTINVTALAGPLKAGDSIGFTGINWVSMSSYQDTGVLAQFVLTADAAASATSISIYPGVNDVNAGPVSDPMVTSAIPTSTQLVSPIAASQKFRNNFVWHADAVTMAFGELPTYGKGIVAAARESYKGTSLRMIQAYDIDDDILKTRLDALYGYAFVRPEWMCRVTDVT